MQRRCRIAVPALSDRNSAVDSLAEIPMSDIDEAPEAELNPTVQPQDDQDDIAVEDNEEDESDEDLDDADEEEGDEVEE